MIQTKATRFLAGALAALMLVVPGGLSASADSEESGSGTTDSWETPSLADLLNTITYEEYLAKNQHTAAGKETITLSGAEILNYNTSLTNAKGVTAVKVNDKDALYLPSEGAVGWTLNNVPAGKYMLKVIYSAVDNEDSKTTSIERTLYINQSVPFYEARFLTLSKSWKDVEDSFQHWEGKPLYRYIKDGQIVYQFTDEDGNVYELGIGESGENKGKMIFNKIGTVDQSKIKGAERYPVYSTDINGNEIKSDKELITIGEVDYPMNPEQKMGIGEIREYIATDSTGYYVDPMQFVLQEGTNTIQLEAQREDMVIYAIELSPVKQYMSYKDYVAYCKKTYGATEIKDGTTVKVQAEYAAATSENTLAPYSDRTSYINEPQDASALLLNSIGGEGGEKWQNVGQWVRYSVTVPKSGFYQVSLRFRQGILEGTFSSRTLRVATASEIAKGEPAKVPFYEAQFLQFNYGDDWQVESLNSGSEDTYLLYLEEGENHLEFEASLGNMADILRQVESAMDTINSVYIKIRMITGTDPDSNVDYGFYRIMPDDIDELQQQRKVLLQVAEDFEKQTGTTGSHAKTLETVATLLERMKKEDKIASNLDNLKENLGTLGTWLQNSKNQPLEIDYVLVGSVGAELPEATDSFWQTIKFEVSQFIRSFTADYNSLGSTEVVDDENVIQVWTTLARDQAQIIRNLINSDFNKNNPGISVELKLVAGGSLLPSILAGVGPDVSMGHGTGDVINWAIRSAIQELNDMEGIEELVGDYDPMKGFSGCHYNATTGEWEGAWFTYAALQPLTLFAEYADESKEPEAILYGLPETQSFSMMFYRADIFKELGIAVPETWDDLIAILPVLQNNNMQVALPSQLGGLNLFLYQMGGDLYADNGQIVSFEDNTTLTAFEYMCEFFSQYRCPYTYDFSNRFRTGEIPLGIMDYTTYTQLSIYATEIKGLWEFVPLPGWQSVDPETGITSIDNTSMAGVSAMIMIKDETRTEEQENHAWTFMKWFVSENTQSEYANELTTLLGTMSKHSTANVNALESLSWTTSEYRNLMSQFENLAAVREYPGGYIIGRYVSFAFLAVYNENADPVDSLQSYVVEINKELTRKRKEFDMKVPADAIE
ncbi:MAG: extracellular solute-binding protein [Clostridia bacterium]|nr:extracellular solute-binding protein [Clostridia bacterium]